MGQLGRKQKQVEEEVGIDREEEEDMGDEGEIPEGVEEEERESTDSVRLKGEEESEGLLGREGGEEGEEGGDVEGDSMRARYREKFPTGENICFIWCCFLSNSGQT